MSLAPSRDVAPTGGPTYDLFVSYAAPDRSWVEGYLFDALDAAGIRHTSEAGFALGAPRVAELERAIRASRRTLLVITPAYLADAYAPFGDLLAQTFGLETGTWPVIPLLLEEAALPARLGMLVALHAARPEAWPAAIDQLCAALGRASQPAAHPPCPYPGMLPFREADAGRFFGRDGEVAEMVQRLRLHRLLAVIGPSGTGKSSLVLAGLLPALRTSALFGHGEWLAVVLRPGAAPLDALRSAFGECGECGEPATAVERVLGRRPGATRLLVVCDQFEEAFAIGREQADAFQDELARLAAVDRCWVVVTVRADFYADLMASPWWPAIAAHRIEVAPLGEPGLRAAIVRPAAAVDVHVDPRLVDRLVADAAGEPGVLPLVQEALVLSWAHLARRFLPLDAYQAIAAGDDATPGATGLQIAMARRADAALAQLPPRRQAIARRVFVRLVQFGEGRADTRRQQRVAELRATGDDPADLDATIGHLVDQRLLTSTGGDERSERRIDLAHEALINGWPTLRGWLADRRDAEQTRRQLDAKAADWVRLGSGRGGLLDEIELAETERWLGGVAAADLGVDPVLAELVTASRAAHDAVRSARRRRVRALVGSLVAGLLLVTGLAVWGALSARSARREEQRALEAMDLAERQRAAADALARTSRSRQLAADSVDQLDNALDRAMLLAVRAHRTEPTPQATSSLVGALQFSPRLFWSVPAGTDEQPHVAVAFAGDGVVATLGVDGMLRRFDAATGARLGAPVEVVADPLSPSVAFSADGRLLAVENCLADEEGTPCAIQLWDVEAGAVRGDPIIAPGPYVSEITFSPDGRLLAVAQPDVDDPVVRLHDTETTLAVGEPIHTRARSLAFSPDGRILASGLEPLSSAGGESSVSLWDVATQELLVATAEYAAGGVSAIDFTPDGAVLAAGHSSGEVSLLYATDLSNAFDPLLAPLGVVDLQFDDDGTVLATSSATSDDVLLWRPQEPEPEALAGHTGEIAALDFAADGGSLASTGVDGRLVLWGMGEHHALLTGGGQAQAVSVSALAVSATEVVTAGLDESTGAEPGSVQITRWDTRAGELAGEPLRADGVVALSTDGRVAAIGREDGTITRVDTATGREVGRPIEAHAGRVTGLTLSDDGATIASAGCRVPDPDIFCDEIELAVWEAGSGRHIAGGSVDLGEVDRLALSPDGRMLAASNGSPGVLLWDVAADRLHPQRLVGADRSVDIAWSPDSRRLAITGESGGAKAPGASGERNNHVTVWDVARAAPVGEPLLDHDAGVTAAAFSPDGTMLASGDFAGEIRLWDAETLALLGERIGTGAAVRVLRFAPDGRELTSGHGDGTIRSWDADPESWAARLCATARRDLTREEWVAFVGADVPYEPTCPGAG